jgi:hypothetical protein
MSVAETLRRLGYCPSGSNPITIKKYVEKWGIDLSHFDPDAVRNASLNRPQIPIEQILVNGSTYNRGHLKRRLYDEDLKQTLCEICGQGETWRGKQMSLILDHINGRRTDNRLENLRIVCPNCAATLPTHCGKGLRKSPVVLACKLCGVEFVRKSPRQRYCSRDCGQAVGRSNGVALRRVERPPYEQLMAEIEATQLPGRRAQVRGLRQRDPQVGHCI